MPVRSRTSGTAPALPWSPRTLGAIREIIGSGRGQPASERRAWAQARPPVQLTPARDHIALTTEVVRPVRGGGSQRGVIAKDAGSPYAPNERLMRKIKHDRTAADYVMGATAGTRAVRWSARLRLGLYDDSGGLHPVVHGRQLHDEAAGRAAGRARAVPDGRRRRASVGELGLDGRHRRDGRADDRRGAVAVEPQGPVVAALRPELMAEVGYDHGGTVPAHGPSRRGRTMSRWYSFRLLV